MIAARPLGCLQSNSNFEHLPGVATLELGEASRCPAPTVTTQAALGAPFSRRRYQSEDINPLATSNLAWSHRSRYGLVGLSLGDQPVRKLRPLASTTAARISSEISVARVLRRYFASSAFMSRTERAASVHSRASLRYSSRCWVSSVSSAALTQFSAWYS